MFTEDESDDGRYSHSNPQSKTERFQRLQLRKGRILLRIPKVKGQKMTKYGTNVFTVRDTDGKLYAKSTYVGIRAAINRHFSSPPHIKKFNILTDLDFYLSNQIFNSMLRKIQAEGLHKASHYLPITEGDMEKLRSSEILSLGSAKTLQYKVWFSLMLQLSRMVKSNDLGIEYVEMVSSEKTKNHQGDPSDKSFKTKPRIYATGANDCPATRVTESDYIWYTSRPVGE
ncbi:hypothetical protein KUTeg_018203 [Tegillarca granosa]|uniref:GIY-YIG domain-containing protein n=1 Tax=Tegillarca granosa TaxID=220873 RepID=A0ABQ9EMI0_TEGGR|nr:hypothetical protein KUTeg_018203 [Tegillarca granosa]